MNKKNLVLISKCCLLLAFLGFCLPVFNVGGSSVTGFLPIVELLKSGPSDLKKASDQLTVFEEANASAIASLDELKVANKNEVKEAKARQKPVLKDAKAKSKVALAAAKEDYKEAKVASKSTIESIKESYSEKKAGLDSMLKEAKGNDVLVDELKAQIAELENSTDEAVRNEKNRLKASKRSADIAARKIFTAEEKAASKEIKTIENKYWDAYDKLDKETYMDFEEEGRVVSKNRQKLVAAKSNAVKEVWVPIALIVFVLSLIGSVLFSIIHYISLKKNSYGRIHYFTDLLLLAIVAASAVYGFNAIRSINGDKIADVTLGFGNILVVLGIVGAVVIYLISTSIDENISSKQEERRAYWLLSSPAIFFYFAVMTFPALFSIVLSFSNYGGGPLTLTGRGHFDFIGFDNYAKVLQDEVFYVSLKNNFYVVLISVFGQLPLGFLLAYVLNRGLVKGRDFFQTMIYLPCVISTVIIGILFQTFFAANGVWTELLQKFNENYQWSMNNHPMIPVLFVILWMYTGTYLIIFLANLQKLDPAIIEAATIDGATEGQVLWHIIFPELSGTFVISAISGSLKSFDLIYVMTAGGPAKQTYVLALYMFDKAFKGAADYPMANTISTIMVVISLALIAVVKTLEKKFGTSDDD